MSQIVRLPEPPQPDPLPQGEGEKPSDRKLITAIKCILCLIVVGYVAFALANHIRRIDWSSVHFDLRLAGLGGTGVDQQHHHHRLAVVLCRYERHRRREHHVGDRR